MMSFRESVEKSFFSEPLLNIDGRATRSEYCWSLLFFVLCSRLFYVYSDFLVVSEDVWEIVSQIILMIPLMHGVVWCIPQLFCLHVRRFHDIGLSGWLFLCLFVGLDILFCNQVECAYFFLIIPLICLLRSDCDNKYGPRSINKKVIEDDKTGVLNDAILDFETLNEYYDNPISYENTKVESKGFVCRLKSLPKEQRYVIIVYLVWCIVWSLEYGIYYYENSSVDDKIKFMFFEILYIPFVGILLWYMNDILTFINKKQKGFLDFFRRNSTEKKLRKRIAASFEKTVKEVLTDPETREIINDPTLGPILIQGTIVNLYHELKNGKEASMFAYLCLKEGLDYYSILSEEFHKAFNKYLIL
mgnify:CR=1 FL=1